MVNDGAEETAVLDPYVQPDYTRKSNRNAAAEMKTEKKQ